MRLGKIATLAAASLLALACGKSGGGAGPTPTPTPTAPTPTPTPVAPHITDVRPHGAGSAGTTWVITGTGFDANGANDVVKFETSSATVTLATATKLVVRAAFAPVASTQTLHVTVTVGGQLSNVFAVTAEPAGSSVPLQVSLWSSADELTSNGGALYVLDRGKNEIFAYDFASGVVRPLVSDTAATITHVFTGPTGTLWFGDAPAAAAERLQTADIATGVPSFVVALGAGEHLQGGTFAGADVYVTTQVGGNNVLVKRITAGTFDATFVADTGSADVPGVWAQGGLVYVSDRTNAQILSIDEMDATNIMTLTNLTGVGRLVGDGMTMLFVVDNQNGAELSSVSTCCGGQNQVSGQAITDFMATNTIALDQATGLAIDANGNLWLAGGKPLNMPTIGNVFPGTQLAALPAIPDPRVVKFDQMGNYSLGVAGFGRIGSVEDVGGTDYFTDFGGCVTLADGTLAGPLFSYDSAGVPRFVGSGPCFGTLRADATGMVFADANANVLSRVSMTDGSLTTIANLTTARSVVRDANGNFYVIGRDTGNAIAGVQLLANDGTPVTNDFVTDANAQLFTAGAIVGTDLWLTELDNGGAFSIVTVPLATGGTPAPLVASGVDVQLDGMEPDGAGGAWIADSESGNVSHVANATVSAFSTGTDPAVGLAVDDYANVVATDVDGTTGVRAILP